MRDKKIKIGFIAHGLCDGGAERVESILANHLVEQGYQVLFVAALSPKKQYYLDPRVQYTYSPSKSNNVLIKLIQKNINVYKQLKLFNPDIIVSFLTNEAFLSGLAIRKPSVFTLRNDPYNYNNSIIKRHIRTYLFTNASRIVFQTVEARNYFDKAISTKGVIIGNPLKKELPYWKDFNHDKVIVTASRLERQKNLPLLLKAFSLFLKTHPDYQLKICGDGTLKEELQNLTMHLNIAKDVEFLGFRNDIHEIMVHSTIFALSSDYEGVSNSMLEAMSIGLPVVCTNSSPGGCATYIKNGINGLLTPVGDVESFHNALCKVADNVRFAQELSEKSILIRKELKQEIVLEKWTETIRNGLRN